MSHDESPNDEIDDVEKEKESDNEIEDLSEDLSNLTDKQIVEKFDCTLKNFLNFS